MMKNKIYLVKMYTKFNININIRSSMGIDGSLTLPLHAIYEVVQFFL